MHAVGWLSLSAGTLWILLAPLAIQVVYGSAFLPAVPALQLFALVCVVAAIHGNYGFALIAAGRQREEMITSACGTLVALPLIPAGYAVWGLTGAAAALVAGECVIWLMSWLFARRSLGLGNLGRYLIAPAISSAFLLAVTFRFLSPRLPVGVQVAVVAVGLASAAIATDAEARRALARFFRHRPIDQRP
jgi:O-antigen/teichoic acid export membrane protein